MADGAEGAVNAATSPDGRVYRVTLDGQTSTVFDPDDTYIWALAVASDGTENLGPEADEHQRCILGTYSDKDPDEGEDLDNLFDSDFDVTFDFD